MNMGANPDVVFATPSLTHTVAKRYCRSMIQTTWLLRHHNLTAGHMDRDGDCFVAKARNKLVWDFLNQFPETQNFFFIDDDIAWEPAKVIEFIQRPEDVVCGVYPKKADELDFPVSLLTDLETGELHEKDGLFMAGLAPTGFMRIRRHVIERLAAESAQFTDMEPDGSEVSYPLIFEAGRGSDGKWWGEDYSFCVKWRALGGEIWVDPSIQMEHQGLKTWKNSLADSLPVFREKARLIAKQKAMAAMSHDEALRHAVEQELAAE